jgi:capsular exopolysaccharide synthesis family protein
MSRIDEALRRAAGQPEQQGDLAADVFHSQDEMADRHVDALAREPFPLEMSKRPPRPAATLSVVSPTPTSAPSPTPTPSPAPVSGVEKVLGYPEQPAIETAKLVTGSELTPGSREQYRRLASVLHRAQESHGLKVVMVTSALQGEGKTLTASNLALTLSDSYQRRVLLIDADLRRPMLHTVFQVNNSSGLNRLASAQQQERLVVRAVSPRLSLLPAGPPTGDPMAGLTSQRMKRVIDEAREEFDWVIVDTPPVVLLTDANLLSAMVDGALLVVRAGSTPHDLVTRAIAALGRDRILGVVLNRAEHQPHAAAGYYQYYHSPDTGTAR